MTTSMTVNYYKKQTRKITKFIVIVNFKRTKNGWKKTVDVGAWTVDGRFTEIYMQWNKGGEFEKMVRAVPMPERKDCIDISERKNGSWLNWQSGYITIGKLRFHGENSCYV